MDNQERRKILIDFILHNQGCTKADIEKALPISRKTIFRLIDEQEEDGIVEEIQEKPNSREHKLFVKKDNPLVIVISELEEFEKLYIQLLKKLNEKIKNIDFSAIASELGIKEADPSKWSESEISHYFQHSREEWEEFNNKLRKLRIRICKIKIKSEAISKQTMADSVDGPVHNELVSVENEISFLEQKVQNYEFIHSVKAPILIFNILIYAYSFRSTFIWPQIIKDKQTRKNLYSIVYTKIAEIQFHLTEFLRSYDKLLGGGTSIMKFIAKKYFGMQQDKDITSLKLLVNNQIVYKEIKYILNSLIRITNEIEEHGGYNFRLLKILDKSSNYLS